jgi:hypothetical protein
MRRLRVALVVIGVAAMGYAAAGAVTDPDVRLAGVLLFLTAVLVAHDGVWLPLVLLAGALLDRVTPARHRGAVRVAAIAAAALTIAALPLALGLGRTADNPSALPLNYGRNLALVLLALAGTTALVTARGRIRDLRRGRKNSESGDDHGGR